MLKERVELLGAAVHGVELVGALFMEYLYGPTLSGDLAECLGDISVIRMIFDTSFNLGGLMSKFACDLSAHLFYRLLECSVVAAFIHGPVVCKDAVAFHYLYPLVQEYRFSRFWLVRLMRAIGGLVVPSRVRNLFASQMGSPTMDPEASFFHWAPLPTGMGNEVFENMPAAGRDALQFYTYNHRMHPAYAVMVGGLVPDVSLFMFQQLVWIRVLMEERQKPTSRWRILKHNAVLTAGNTTQSVLACIARIAGAFIGRAISNEPTGCGIFWCETVAVLAISPIACVASTLVAQWVRAELEKLLPATPEDEMEDTRAREQAEEAAPPSSSSNDMGNHITDLPPGPSYYEVLGVDEKAQTADIKRAYRQMALKNHPDRVANDPSTQQQAREQMATINDAYDVLVNENKRAQYDAVRMMNRTPNFVNALENMTPVQLVALGTVSALGASVALSMLAYIRLKGIYQQATSMGRAPIIMFG